MVDIGLKDEDDELEFEYYITVMKDPSYWSRNKF